MNIPEPHRGFAVFYFPVAEGENNFATPAAIYQRKERRKQSSAGNIPEKAGTETSKDGLL